jgi:integrase
VKSEAWKKSNQQPRMKAALKAAGIERHIRFHDLRHTFASLLAMSGTNMKVISNQLGHSSVRTTEAFYAHLSPDHIAAEVRANKPTFTMPTGS